MRQSRDGVTEIIDVAPPAENGGSSRLLKPPIGAMRSPGSCALMAWVWVAKGLFNWAVVLGLFRRASAISPMLPRPLQGTIVFFAAADLLAAVGLWLAAPWGGVLWLLCAVIEAISPVFGARQRRRRARRRAQRRARRALFRAELARGFERR